jgi:UPF0755 protein
MPTGRRRGRLSLLVLLILAFAICGAVWLLGVFALGTPDRAEGLLGQPSPSLNPIQQAFLATYLMAKLEALDSPAGSPEASLDLNIAQGEPASAVISSLQQAGVVNNPSLLRAYLRYRGLDVGIEAGDHRLSGSMTVRELADALQTARPLEIVFGVLEGWRLEEIADSIPTSGLAFLPEDFLAAAHTRPSAFSLSSEVPDPFSLEGFLFPDTYRLAPEVTAAEVVEAMLANFDTRVGPDLRQGFLDHGLTVYQGVTLASMVEREAVQADERPIVASVFYNRLGAGMRLESDPTVQYALGLQLDGRWWKSPLTLDDLSIGSPYNTYLIAGLPPGPIANPGLASLQAAAFPADTPYYYFRALCDGSGRHAFAETYEEHLGNACP